MIREAIVTRESEAFACPMPSIGREPQVEPEAFEPCNLLRLRLPEAEPFPQLDRIFSARKILNWKPFLPHHHNEWEY